MDFEKRVSATTPVFRYMNSHRGHRGHREVIKSPLCPLCPLWLTVFIPCENRRNERVIQATALFSFSSSLPIWPFHGGMTSVTLPEAFNWQASRIGESLSPVKPS